MDSRVERETLDGVLNLLGRYLHVTDSGDADAWVDLFTEDGAFMVRGRSFVGRDALHSYIVQIDPGVHSCGLPAVTVSGGEVNSTCPYLFVSSTSGRILAGHYFDRIDVRSEPYRFIERRVERGAQAPC